jgi:hypothetical protein
MLGFLSSTPSNSDNNTFCSKYETNVFDKYQIFNNRIIELIDSHKTEINNLELEKNERKNDNNDFLEKDTTHYKSLVDIKNTMDNVINVVKNIKKPGVIRYNSIDCQFEGFTQGKWVTLNSDQDTETETIESNNIEQNDHTDDDHTEDDHTEDDSDNIEQVDFSKIAEEIRLVEKIGVKNTTISLYKHMKKMDVNLMSIKSNMYIMWGWMIMERMCAFAFVLSIFHTRSPML